MKYEGCPGRCTPIPGRVTCPPFSWLILPLDLNVMLQLMGGIYHLQPMNDATSQKMKFFDVCIATSAPVVNPRAQGFLFLPINPILLRPPKDLCCDPRF